MEHTSLTASYLGALGTHVGEEDILPKRYETIGAASALYSASAEPPGLAVQAKRP